MPARGALVPAGHLAEAAPAAAAVVDPHAFAVGTVAAALEQYPHVGDVLPAIGLRPGAMRRTH